MADTDQYSVAEYEQYISSGNKTGDVIQIYSSIHSDAKMMVGCAMVLLVGNFVMFCLCTFVYFKLKGCK